MNKKTFSVLFTCIATLSNIVVTLAMIIGSSAICYVIMHYGFKVEAAEAYLVVWMLCFIIGMVGNMFLFNKVLNKIVIKHHLEPKLEGWALSRTSRSKKYDPYTYEEVKEEKPKSRMPSSVIEEEDPWESK